MSVAHTRAGGLGDVMGALPKAMAKRGHRVMVVAPRYSNYENVNHTGVRHRISMFGGMQEVSLGGSRKIPLWGKVAPLLTPPSFSLFDII